MTIITPAEKAQAVLLQTVLPDLSKSKPPVFKTRESAVKAACMGWLAQHKIFIWRNNTGSYKTQTGHWVAYGFKGSPDIIGMTKTGRFLGIECKSDTGTLRPEQKAFRDATALNGGLYIVARSIDDLEAWKWEICR